jgi:hypothetical protein
MLSRLTENNIITSIPRLMQSSQKVFRNPNLARVEIVFVMYARIYMCLHFVGKKLKHKKHHFKCRTLIFPTMQFNLNLFLNPTAILAQCRRDFGDILSLQDF